LLCLLPLAVEKKLFIKVFTAGMCVKLIKSINPGTKRKNTLRRLFFLFMYCLKTKTALVNKCCFVEIYL